MIPSVLYVVQALPAKFGLRAGNKKFNTQNDKWIRNHVYNFTCVLCMDLMQYKNTDNYRNIF
jgi:hypothetical protein